MLDQFPAVERLRHVAVGTYRHGLGRIDRSGPTEKQHRNVLERCVRPHALAELVAAQSRHQDVGQNQVRSRLLGCLERRLAITCGDQLHVLARKRHADRLLNRLGIVSEEQGLGHARGLHRGCSSSTRLQTSRQAFAGAESGLPARFCGRSGEKRDVGARLSNPGRRRRRSPCRPCRPCHPFHPCRPSRARHLRRRPSPSSSASRLPSPRW